MARRRTDLRVMVDANILIAGTVWPRWPYEVLRHALQKDFQLVLSQYIINQARRRITKRFPAYLDRFEEFLRSSGYEQAPHPTKRQLSAHGDLVRDRTDLPIVLAATSAKVDYLVSEDKDLTAHDESTAILRKVLTVMLSGTFLRQVMGWSSEDLERVRRRTWSELGSDRQLHK